MGFVTEDHRCVFVDHVWLLCGRPTATQQGYDKHTGAQRKGMHRLAAGKHPSRVKIDKLL
jgi:hypothetical protein